MLIRDYKVRTTVRLGQEVGYPKAKPERNMGGGKAHRDGRATATTLPAATFERPARPPPKAKHPTVFTNGLSRER